MSGQDDFDWGSMLQNYSAVDGSFDSQKFGVDLATIDWNLDLSTPSSSIETPLTLTPTGTEVLSEPALIDNYFSLVQLLGDDSDQNLSLSQIPSLSSDISKSTDLPTLDSPGDDDIDMQQSPRARSIRSSSKPTSEPKNTGTRQPTARRRTHYAVEQRYRANLNQKILALAAVIPSLTTRSENGMCDQLELEGSSKAGRTGNRINKSAVLSSALEYIQELEKRCKDKEEIIQKLQDSALVAGRHLDAMHRLSR